MEISQEENGKYFGRIFPVVSATSSTGAQFQNLPSAGGHIQLNSSFTSSKHMANRKVKFMCSSGGKILPRPSDMKLRYVGGETRMVSLPHYIEYQAFYAKMVELYGPDIIIKYQLPQEDLDALVSVSSDEDLENMLEECDRLSASEGSTKLRVFVFLASELDGHDLDDNTNFKSSERKFVDAINSISGDALPMHSTGNLYTNSDSFTDAYKAWNGIQSQDQGSCLSKNLYSEGLFPDDYVSSGDIHSHENFVPGQLQCLTSPFSHSAFMGQQVNPNTFAATSVLSNDLDTAGWKDSHSFFGQGAGHTYVDMNWTTASEMHVQEPDHRREDRTYIAGHSFGEHSMGKSEGVQFAQEHFGHNKKAEKASKIEQTSAPENAMARVEESPFRGVESADNLKMSAGQLHGDLLALSPGAFLQKQLTSSPSALAPSQKQIYSDRSSDRLIDADNMQSFPMSNSLENQQQAFFEHVQEDQWERFPPCESPFALDEENQAVACIQRSTAVQAPPFSRESSVAIFPASSAPSSPPGWKLQTEKNSESEDDPCKASVVGLSPQNNTVLVGSAARISVSVAPFPKMSGEKVHTNAAIITDQTLAQDFSNLNLNIVTEESYPLSGSHSIDQEGIMNRGQFMRKPLNVLPDPAILASADEKTWQPSVIQSDEERDRTLLSVTGQHAPGLSLSQGTCLPSQLDIDAMHQHNNKHFDRFSNLSEGPRLDNMHNFSMLSDLLSSCRLTECLPVPSSTAESPRSRSAYSLDEEPYRQENDNLIAMAGKDSLLKTSEGLDFPLSTLGNSQFSSFETNLNSLPSNEQFDRVLISSFSSDFDNRNYTFAEASSTTKQEDINIPAPHTTRVPAFTSLIETWEANLLQDENEQDNVMQQLVMCEQAQEQIDTNPTFDKEIGLEESRVEFEEVEEFPSFDYGPMNAAAIAEQEAISRGLQIIRNCDLEELRELGSGTFGTVYHGKWRGTDVAIKRIKASCFNGRQAERDRLVADFWREAYILGQLHHPNVVAFYGVVPDGPGGTLATVTEYMVNGSLKQVLQNKDRTLDRRKRLLIAMDAAFGMEYLHGKNVVHFDIKCENLLVNLKDTQRPICKVGDLGLSKVKQQTFVSGGVRGTLPWMAPELLNGSSSLVSEKVDVFSFGIVMWELLTGEEPYANMHYGAIIGGIVNNTLRPTVPRWCDPAWRSLMEKCWAADPNERPTFLEIAGTLRAMEASLAAKGPAQARILEMYQ